MIDNHAFPIQGGEPFDEGESVSVPVTIPEVPPNKFRKDTGQGIPVASNVNGKTVEKKVKYTPKRAKQ